MSHHFYTDSQRWLQRESARYHATWLECIAALDLVCFRTEGMSPLLADMWAGDSVGIASLQRWDLEALRDGVHPLRVRFGGFVSGVEAFDAAAFGITPPEALLMDPQQRLLMEVPPHTPCLFCSTALVSMNHVCLALS